MNYDQFEDWFKNLSAEDRQYLEKDKDWKKSYEKALKSRVLPKGFVEQTMERLEGGSESET